MADDPKAPVDAAVESLAKAETPAELLKAHRVAKRSVAAFRRRAEKLGTLAQVYTDAIEIWDTQKAAGVSKDERLRDLEARLRLAWPQARTWVYECDQCRDTGLVMSVCQAGARCNGISTRHDYPKQAAGKYRRLCAQFPESDYQHEYGTPCWCARGSRFKESRHAPAAEDFAQSGRTKKPGMTKLGR